jgi:XTP/dITP diphosphohydrolase
VKRLHLATTNRHKAEEVRAILEPLGVEVVLPERLPPVAEDGATFGANAEKKAVSAARHLGAPALADDSGLVVPLLGGEPGVLSARYAGPGATDADNNALLVRKLEALRARDPEASFVCHVVVAAPDGSIVARAEDRVTGVLRWPPLGRGGFGYDPLFHLPALDKRFAELSPSEKNRLSHRGRALRRLASMLALLAVLWGTSDLAAADALEDAVGRAKTAVEKKDAAALAELARAKEPDPWLVADELLGRGERARPALWEPGS